MLKILVFLSALAITSLGQAQPTGSSCPRNASTCTSAATGSTTARTLAARAADVVNIKDYGAVCDGSTDDRTAINATMTAASSGTAKTVFFPPSSTACMMASSVTVPANVTLWGYPGTVTVKAKAGNVSSPLMFDMGNNSTMDGLIIDGGGATFGSSNSAVTVFQKTDVTVQNTRFQNIRGIGLIFSTSIVRARVINNVFYNVGNYWKTSALAADRAQGLAFCCGTKANNYGNMISGNYFEDIGLDAISIDVQTDMQVVDNRFRLDNGQLTQIWTNPQPTALSAAIYAIGTDQLLVSGNMIAGASGNGIDTQATNNTITANSIYSSGQAGIGCFATGATTNTNCTITGNQILRTGSWATNGWLGGISMGNSPNNAAYNTVIISDNTVVDNAGVPTQNYGVWASSSTSWSSLYIGADNRLTGTVSQFGGALPYNISPTTGQVGYETATSGTITKHPAATTLRLRIVGAGGSAGVPITCGAGISCGGPGGGGGGATSDIELTWTTLGVTSCTWTLASGVAPGGAAAAATAVTCGSLVFSARSGGPGQAGAVAAATGGGSGATPLNAGNAGAGGSGGTAPGPLAGTCAAAGGSGIGGSQSGNLACGSGGGGSSALGVASSGGNGYGATAGASGAGCNAGVAAAASVGGQNATTGLQAAASTSGTFVSGWPGNGGGGGASHATSAAGNGGNGATPGGGAGGAGNGCNNVGTPGTSGTSGGGGIFWWQR